MLSYFKGKGKVLRLKRVIATVLAMAMIFTSFSIVTHAQVSNSESVGVQSFSNALQPLQEPMPLLVDAGTWFETAWVAWISRGPQSYRVFVRLTPGQNAYYWRTNQPINDPAWDIALGWTEIDSELIRLIDPARQLWRADILGLPRGTYDIEVRAADGSVISTINGLQTTSFHRYGAAFIPSNQLVGANNIDDPVGPTTDWALYGATGGYLSDGRVDPNAVIMYVSHNNWDDFIVENLNRDNEFRNNNPMIVRFLGSVGTFDWREGYSQIPPNVSPTFGDNDRMMTLQNAHQITLEGVGTGATLYGWGIFTGSAVNVVIRNLHVDGYFSFGLRASGTTTNFWAHNNTLHYGQNWFFNADGATDRTMGRGSMDIEQWVRGYTLSYNHFNGGRGTNLIVGGVQNAPLENNVHRHYGTIHHNIYDSAQERNPRTRHHNLHIFNNLFRDVLGHPLHYRLADRYTGYGLGAAHNATIWAEGNIFDDVGFPFLRGRHGHARGYYPHTGFNHFFGDGPGFLVTGDNVLLGTGESVGAMYIPAFGADLGYRNTVRGLDTEEQHANFVVAVNRLQPNVMCASTASTFDSLLDLGITVSEEATMKTPPEVDMETAIGFPALNGNAANHGWGFEGDFRPSTAPENVWATGTPAQVATLRTHIETYAGAMPALSVDSPVVLLVAPIGDPNMPPVVDPSYWTMLLPPSDIRTTLNRLDYIMHRQNSPTPSLRTINYEGTFSITWSSNDIFASHYEIQFQDGDNWRTLGTIPSNSRANSFVTQDMSDFGYLIMSGGGHDWVAVHLGGDGYVVMYPHANFGYLGNPMYTIGQVPSVSDLQYTAPWVIADLVNGGTYNFRVRAVYYTGNSEITSDWVEVSHVVAPNQARITNISQATNVQSVDGVVSVNSVSFSIETAGLLNGTYDVSLSVPRSAARNVIPWPAARNFSGCIFLEGATDLETGNDSPKTGNGGTGRIQIVDGVGTIVIEIADDLPAGSFDLVLTISGLTTVVLPFSLEIS